MGDLADDSEDATSSLGDEERVRKLFQACDSDGDGFIDSNDLLTVCRELNLEESVEALMRELGADEHGRICYREFLRRRVALRPEIDAIKASQPAQPDYLPTSSENSLGEGKLSWEFDSGARDLSPEPTQQAASGNLLELANKLHVAAMASLKAEILDLSNRLQCAMQERDHFEKTAHKLEAERRRTEQKMLEDAELHEEQLTELHSVIAELTRKNLQQRSMVIQEEETSEADDTAALDTSQTPDVDCQSDVSSDGPEADVEPEEAVVSPGLEEQLAASRADNAMLQERLNRALQDLEVISQMHAKKGAREAGSLDPVRVARVSSPSCVLGRTSPSLVEPFCRPVSPRAERSSAPQPRVAERVRLRKVDAHVTGSDITALGVFQTQVAETLVASVQEASDCQELGARGQLPLQAERLAEQVERTRAGLEHVRAQNTVLTITIDQARDQLDRLSLLVGQYESNAVAFAVSLGLSDAALEVAEALLCLLETELGLVLANCRPKGEDDQRFLHRAADSRRQAERHARELLRNCGQGSAGCGDWTPADEGRLRDRLAALKSERNKCRSTVLTLESLHIEPIPGGDDGRKMDLEAALLMQELMGMREERVELKARHHLLEKERAAQELRAATQKAQLQAVLQMARQLQESQVSQEQTTAIINALENLASCEIRRPEAALGVDLRMANTALITTLERCKKKYQSRLRRLESQMTALVERHSQQVKALRQKIAHLEESGTARLDETNI